MSILFFLVSLLFVILPSYATTFPLPSQGDLVGSVFNATAREGDTLFEIGKRYDIGYDQMVDANRNVVPTAKLQAGTQVLIPGQCILPAVRSGVVINLAELRLYYYPPDRNVVVIKPIGIGRDQEWNTPTGSTTVVKKTEDPIWRPTPHMRAYEASLGTPIPEAFPAGADNPMGDRALYLGWPTYAIHGTNLPESVGGRVSGGCIRMMPSDIRDIYNLVPVGTTVTVVNQPFKAGWYHGRLYFEAHRPLAEQRGQYKQGMSSVVNIINDKTSGRHSLVSWTAVQDAVKNVTGIPEVINIH